MKRSTLGVGLKSDNEDWFTSSSIADDIPRERLGEVAAWVFREAKRRMTSGGWEGKREVTVSVTAHAETILRLLDESEEVATAYRPEDAREMLGHLFSEAMGLVYRGPDDDGGRDSSRS